MNSYVQPFWELERRGVLAEGTARGMEKSEKAALEKLQLYQETSVLLSRATEF